MSLTPEQILAMVADADNTSHADDFEPNYLLARHVRALAAALEESRAEVSRLRDWQQHGAALKSANAELEALRKERDHYKAALERIESNDPHSWEASVARAALKAGGGV